VNGLNYSGQLQHMKKITAALFCFFAVLFLVSCSVQKQVARQAKETILANPDFGPAHVGISLYDPSTQQYLYNFQGDKFFVPASNTKLFTCYAAMKNLGDSLVGLRYIQKDNATIEVEANGDASFLLNDFKNQPVFDFLKKQKKIILTDANWRDNALGMGWAWDDYNSDYMAERSVMPIYGNVVKFNSYKGFSAMPSYFKKSVNDDGIIRTGNFSIRREFAANVFSVRKTTAKFSATDIPFYTAGNQVLFQLLKDTLQSDVELSHEKMDRSANVKKLYSQPTDSLLKIMMHRSDNFFAEQTLLMVSNEKLEVMNDSRIIDTLLKTDFAGLPQKPKWVDGSGLSRYNLISPQDFVWVLTQMKNEFKWERITNILPTGGEGTLASYYKNYSGRIFAKTGSLSNHLALSGYIITKKGRTLIFSVLVNAHQTAAANIRKGVEKFLVGIMERY
jgi:D-alanyl-D-alanine carboxypeptidase/D-alanyl-D-alanine-endopeptidase (penicillin-binding protein 4)